MMSIFTVLVHSTNLTIVTVSKLGTNGLLSSSTITSRISQEHCYTCDFLFSLKNSNPFQVQTTRPLKEFVATFKPNSEGWDTNGQQDCTEFLEVIISECEILNQLTKFSVNTHYKCKSCDNKSQNVDNMNILYAKT